MKMFVDSWGWIWETCTPDAEGACAFGPCGCARETGLHINNLSGEEVAALLPWMEEE